MTPLDEQDEHVRLFRSAVLRFYSRHRRDLPWRRSQDAYHILVSEVMLQQTQVNRVIPKYERFLARFPTVHVLASARLRDVVRAWIGLGYNSRGLRLWRCAKIIAQRHGGVVPDDVEQLRALPGIGTYTACAIASFAYGKPHPAIDTNVRRVLSRVLFGRDSVSAAVLRRAAARVFPARAARRWCQALMDVAALHCRSSPRCEGCPALMTCRFAPKVARALPRRPSGSAAPRKAAFAGSPRFFRGRIIRILSGVGSMPVARLLSEAKDGSPKAEGARIASLVDDLRREGLLRIDRRRRRVWLP
ncbi:MAG: A/G-specific adenine glycosylase [Candidatus Eremiobacter antarcticus]